MAASPRRSGGRRTNNYFKVVYCLLDADKRSRHLCAFFFFDDRDRTDIDRAFLQATESIASMNMLEGARPSLSVFRKLAACGGVVQIGECMGMAIGSEAN